MNRSIKWVLIIGGALVGLVILVLVLVPFFVDIDTYKPRIEREVAEATGRSFAIDGPLRLSLFPWAGVAFTGLHLGNPDGFGEKEMLDIQSFEVRVKLLPLIFKDIQVKRFIVESPRIVLVKDKRGRGSWEGIGKKTGSVPPPAPSTAAEKATGAEASGKGLPIKDLTVGEFAVTGGSLLFIDQAAGTRKEVADLTLLLTDVSLDRPVKVAFSARVDGKPVGLEGTVGPLGRDIGKGPLPLHIIIKALGQVELAVKGQVTDLAGKPTFDVGIALSQFSPRKLMAALGQKFPVETADPAVLGKVSLKVNLKGTPAVVSMGDGSLILDDSTLTFSGKAEEFSRPVLLFKMQMDGIDLDRYLPPKKEGGKVKGIEAPSPAGKKEKTDYGPLRKLILDADVRIEKLKAVDARMEKVRATVKAKGGLINTSLAAAMYEGAVSASTELNVTGDTPKTAVRFDLENLRVNPLLRDMFKKDVLEGATEARMALTMAGDNAAAVKKTLAGEGMLRFKDGAIKGIDLASMARNIGSAFSTAESVKEKPRTDFSELFVPFAISRGVARTAGATMASPFIRIKAAGKADLVAETIDFRIDPKLVGTLKGQGDTADRSGISVPVIVSGTFASPKFAPDLEGAVRGKVEDLVKPDALKSLIPGGGARDKNSDPVKGLLKGLPFGN